MKAAIAAIEAGASIRRAAQEFGVFQQTLARAAARAGVKSHYNSRWRGKRLADRLAGGVNDPR